jgi:hypothetical protein
MPDEPQNIAGNPIPTEGFPNVYANIATLTANFTDIRIYFADAHPKLVATAPAPMQPTLSEATIAPRICLVLTPEFAKSLVDALSGTISMYEKQFGPLRQAPQPPVLIATQKPPK